MLFTSEQVSAGHPDKICDQISDAIVTDCLKNDRNSRVAVEALIKENHVVVAGEITSKHTPPIAYLVRSVLMFTEPAIYDSFDLQTFITRQSEDIALGVDKKGAGDQGSVFGYATNETHEMLPMPFVLATDAIERLDLARHPALGKDATKLDRSGAYMARKIAKDILRHNFAGKCEVQLAYAIGVEEPVSISVKTFGTGRVPHPDLVKWIRKNYDLTPNGIISTLGLRDVNYNRTATLGHFWNPSMPWEN